MMDWLTIIGFVLIIEGMIPLLFPKQWLNYVQKLALEPIGTIRIVGGILFILGALLLVFR
ncbi:MAG: hypothetical protein ACJAZB_000309 [Psychrosphaera sp.]|jgi:uncharacterized protein YjeT (DUF2065 family)|uniref:DUF2065 domain-containing protein n=1 Tax=Psychrosphaera aquimarina TaxID=2044854 RepID=A0ABU3R243_9GAMM|nr:MULTISPECIES: DUF2065 domain-containing protein [Psychrosphaera]MDU0113732.1 DUF2065 domain-containing protein [Psychrosphaera aquimarina]